MIEFLSNLIFGNPILADVTYALGPLALAGISAGASALGGLFSSKRNKVSQQPVPEGLTDLIGQLEDPNFFLDQINQMFNDDATAFNIDAQLASQGVDSPAFAREQLQAELRRQGEQKTQALGNLEGLRLRGLQNAFSQLNNINANNAGLRQQQTNNALDIISSTTSGVGGSFIQGLGAKMQQQNLERILGQVGQQGGQGGQIGGMGFNLLEQFGTGGFGNPGGFAGIGGDNNFG